MASSNSLFPKGNSIHRPPIFNGKGYQYWKTRMQIFIEAIDLTIWVAIEIGPYIPTVVDVSTSTTTPKPRDKWTEEDKRRIQYDLKAKNIITSVLGIDEYFMLDRVASE